MGDHGDIAVDSERAVGERTGEVELTRDEADQHTPGERRWWRRRALR